MSEGQEDVVAPPSLWRRVQERLHRNRITRLVTKVVVTVVGVLVIAVGIFLAGPGIPGPGFLVILAGLAILSTEYEWARRVLEWARERYEHAKKRMRDMDPAVRRRRTLLTIGTFVVVTGAVVTYLALYGWPGVAVSGWDWLQSLSGVVPELPGM